MTDTKLTDLYLSIEQSIEQLRAEKDGKAYLRHLNKALKESAHQILSIGDEAYAQAEIFETEKNTSIESTVSFLLTFKWAEIAKSFLILWRNILFEQEKAQVLLLTCRIDEDAIQDLRNRSEAMLLEALNELKLLVGTEYQAAENSEKQREKILEPLFLQTNPWPTYQQQIKEIEGQGTILQERQKSMLFVVKEFDKIEALVRKTVINCQSEISESEMSLDEIIDYVNENSDENPGKIVTHLEVLEKNILTHDHASDFTAILTKETQNLPTESMIPVAIYGSMIELKDINFRKNTRQWLDSEILPLLYEVWEVTEGIRTGLKMSLLNIRNRALLLDNEKKEIGESKITTEDLCRPLQLFKETSRDKKKICAELYELIDQRLKAQFDAALIYSVPDKFLEIPLQSTINNLVFSQNEFFTRIKNWWFKQLNTVRILRTNVKREDALSISEKVVRYLENRAPDIVNNQYSGIFLTKGYIGESFRVGREEEVKRMEQLIEHWKMGYRGAVILTGQRFSGKTLFGDLTSNLFFENNTIRLHPDSEIEVLGRRFNTKRKLISALDFIKKYTLQSQSLIWLDNLELWSSADFTLSENVRALQQFIDDYSGRIFIVVSMSNALKAHLDKTHDLDRFFQAEINMDRMPKDDIARAIAIRHGATHKKIINDEQEEISLQVFTKLTDTIFRISEGNIGEALSNWSNSLEKISEKEVKLHGNPNYDLPDFITSDTAVLLSTILLKKRTNEYDLVRLFGPSFSKKYGNILQRLLSLGLLKRHLDGKLEITETAVNDIGRLLEKHRYLSFSK
ncbi:MAG: hypothetical protein ACI85O_000292 [Saprospiraceae bacterium]|jgi:hypothetical protein